MSRVTQLKITGFYDNDNYLLNFTAKFPRIHCIISDKHSPLRGFIIK